ncbi:MAG: hypothetical protein IGS03_04780 [Candidatus Sericytochromatia bacterium]|nr:hypothetical protein [Candidatus Sericytochromatia bacterium]
MPSYDEWGQAIVDYFSKSLAQGEPLYLRTDAQTLEEVGRLADWHFKRPVNGESWCEDFVFAVRNYMLTSDKKVDEHWIYEQNKQLNPLKPPKELPWLAFQVLAASKMRRDDQKTMGNYYGQLRELLQLPGQSKPKGIDYPIWEGLWRRWNRWVSARGWEPTARKEKQYIDYPILQCLLRDGEGDQVQRLWYQKKISADLNRSQLRQWFNGKTLYQINKRLHQQLYSGQPPELFDLLYHLYLDGAWQSAEPTAARIRPSVEAGLYRFENSLNDTISYQLYPRQRASMRTQSLSVRDPQGQVQELQLQRPGWFAPLEGALQDPRQNLNLEIVAPEAYQRLIFRGAPIWALVQDPDQPDSYATWHRPDPGENFILFCHEDLQNEIKQMVRQGLLSYEERKYGEAFGLPQHWLEYYDCQILRNEPEAWRRLQEQAPDIWELLYPRGNLYLSTSGGLRARSQEGQRGWLADYAPQVQVQSNIRDLTDTQLQVWQIHDSGEETLYWEGQVDSAGPHTLFWNGPGQYRVNVQLANGTESDKQIRLLDWPELSLPLVENGFAYEMENKMMMRGGLLQDA